MNMTSIFNRLFTSGSSLAKQGQEMIQNKLNTSDNNQSSGASASRMSDLGKGALAGGALSLLLGTKKGRKLSGTALKYGGIAALGTVAYKAYGDWKKDKENSINTGENSASSDSNTDGIIPKLNHVDESENTNLILEEKGDLLMLKAMIAAAKADGHVDEAEQEKIQSAINALGASEEVNQFFQQELAKPLDPEEICRDVSNPEEAAEIYLASLLVTEEKNFMEKSYLKELARLLKLEPGLVDHLESQVQPA